MTLGGRIAGNFMRRWIVALLAACAVPFAHSPAFAQDTADAGIQCVPYVRDVTGIRIYGDAHLWWSKAEGAYARGNRPAVGAVMAFRPYGSMQLGHVAAVSRILDSRRVLLDHANWSTIDGRRGQIERGVLAMDVSPGNDWSEVRVWYAPIGDLGTTRYPIYGFIYPQATPQWAAVTPQVQPQPERAVLTAPAQDDPIGALLERLGQ